MAEEALHQQPGKAVVDYSLYLVTDSTPTLLRGRHLGSIVRNAIVGGVTVVQFRDKTSDTGALIRTASELHAITQELRVPLLINDRVDVAIAVGAEGVHIGQDDIDLATARRLLGPDAIIGVTASNVNEAIKAAEGGADYIGLGTVFATQTKQNTKSIVGPSGIRDMLNGLSMKWPNTKTVCIGGMNATNCQRVLYQSEGLTKKLDGIAVVSAIIDADDPMNAAKELKLLVRSTPPFSPHMQAVARNAFDKNVVREYVPAIVKTVEEMRPVCHNMTNLVVQNFAANVAICIGASPIMSNNGNEAYDLAQLGGSLVVNMGTVTKDGLENYTKALIAYNAIGGPVLLDPVGAGATQQRREAVKVLMNAGYFDVMKGNVDEIKTLAGVTGGAQQRGVDSAINTISLQERAAIVKNLAIRERNVILMTGKVDILSDGHRTMTIENGHEYLGSITGSGCTLGTTIAAFLAVYKEDKMLAALSGILMYEIAAERAAERGDVAGPGTFVPAFLDELHAIKQMAKEDDVSWVGAARVRML